MKINKITLLSLGLLLLSSVLVFSTAQQPDYIIYKTKFMMLFSNPLEEYPWEKKERPDFNVISTANYRGYVAVWIIENNKLYLIGINAYGNGKLKQIELPSELKENDEGLVELGKSEYEFSLLTLEDIFGDRVVGGRILADWYTGTLRIPQGEEIEYVHSGYGSKFEKDLFIEVHEGIVSKNWLVDNTNKN